MAIIKEETVKSTVVPVFNPLLLNLSSNFKKAFLLSNMFMLITILSVLNALKDH